MGRFFDTVLARPLDDEVERDFERVLERALEVDDADTDTALERVRAGFERMEAPSDALLARLAEVLGDAADEVRLAFWRDTCARLPGHGYAAACYGDALLDAGRSEEALEVLLRAVEQRPEWLEEFDELEALAERAGGRPWLRCQLVALRARLDRDSAGLDEDSEDQGVDVREWYSELLEQYRGDRAALAEIRALGERITALEEQGVLPSVLVRRGDWRGD